MFLGVVDIGNVRKWSSMSVTRGVLSLVNDCHCGVFLTSYVVESEYCLLKGQRTQNRKIC